MFMHWKISIFLKLTYRLNIIPTKIPVRLFCGNQEPDSKVYIENKTRIAKIILKRNKVVRFMQPNYETIKTMISIL